MALIVHEGNNESGIIEREMTPDEEAAHLASQADAQAAQAAWEAERAAAQQQRNADLALLRAEGLHHPDPVVQAAARLLDNNQLIHGL